jgi:hypothetical protein
MHSPNLGKYQMSLLYSARKMLPAFINTKLGGLPALSLLIVLFLFHCLYSFLQANGYGKVEQ